MESRDRSHIRLAVVIAVALAVALGTAPVVAARRARHAAGAQAPSAVPLSQIHVLGDRPVPFGLDAKSAMMVDARSGAILYAYNEHNRIQPASLAKLMTFYLALQAMRQGRITLETSVTVSEKAWRLSMNSTVSRMFLEVGQRVSVNDLLYGLMVSSGNDAAVALAEYLGGSTEAFTEQMNQEGRKLGLSETHFENPDGLPVAKMYTTAADMVKLGRSLLQHFPDAVTYTATMEFTFDRIRQRNFNTLLFYDRRVNGLKTGYVEEAGYHLVASAQSDAMQLISAVLGAPSMEARRVESEKLIDWAFGTFSSVKPDWHKVVPDQLRVYGGVNDKVAVAPAEAPYVTVSRGQEGKVSLQGSFARKYLVAPVRKGQKVGDLVLMADGKPQATIVVLTQASVTQGGLVKRFIDRARMRLQIYLWEPLRTFSASTSSPFPRSEKAGANSSSESRGRPRGRR